MPQPATILNRSTAAESHHFREGGFTLLELLLAVSITGVIAVVLFASLSLGLDMRRQGERRLSDRGAARLALDLLAEDLTAAPRPAGTIAEPFVAEDGRAREALDADTLAFVTAATPLPTEAPLADLRLVRWELVDDPIIEDRYQLVRRVTDNLLAPVTPEPTTQIIARRVRSLSLRFDDGAEWVADWDSADLGNRLPRAVEMTLIIEPEHRAKADDRRSDDDEQPLIMRRVVILPASTTEASATRG